MTQKAKRVVLWIRAIRNCKAGAAGKSTAPFNAESCGRDACPKAADATLPGKTSKESGRRPYHKPTQVDESKCSQALERTLAQELGTLAP